MLIILAFLAATILIIVAAYEDRHRHSKYSKVRLKGLIISAIVMVISALGASIIPYLTYEEKVQTNEYNVVKSITYEQAIKKNKIGNEDTYIFFFQDNDDLQKMGDEYVPRIKICNILAKDSTVYEEDISKPYIIEYTIYTRHIFNDFWRKLLLGPKIGETSESKTYDIFIPKGTIIGDMEYAIPTTNIFDVSEG